MTRPLITQLVGSYTKPNWLINHHRVTSPSATFWRPDEEVLAEAQDDATIVAIADQERAGLDVITDGEQRRQRFDTYFFRWGGLDTANLGRWSMENRDMSFIDLDPEVKARLAQAMAPRVVSEITWPGPIALNDLRFLKRHTRRPVKMTVIGPLTSAARLVNEYYPDEEAVGMAVARVINQELRALQAEGVDIIQLDEPDFHFRHDDAVRWGTAALNAALEGIQTTTAVHLCYGYAMIGEKHVDPYYGQALAAIAASAAQQISLEYEQPGHTPELLRQCGDKVVILGCLNLGTHTVEKPEYIAGRIRAAREVVPPERLHLAPDCGMWFLPRQVAFAKLRALVVAAEIVRSELG
ncbi:MAG: 5-methyltetrahydropteroyltriglutamate--homocysteine methyltransferase [Anaerolineae bacterium]